MQTNLKMNNNHKLMILLCGPVLAGSLMVAASEMYKSDAFNFNKEVSQDKFHLVLQVAKTNAACFNQLMLTETRYHQTQKAILGTYTKLEDGVEVRINQEYLSKLVSEVAVDFDKMSHQEKHWYRQNLRQSCDGLEELYVAGLISVYDSL